MVEGTDMSERENILGRIREALSQPAGFHAPRPDEPAAAGTARQWLPQVGADFADQLALFQANAGALKAEFHLLGSREELVARVRALADAERWGRVAAHQGDLVRSAVTGLGLPTVFTDSGYDRNELERCDAGLTECDALVAQTGSVLVTSRSAGGRALSVLPPHHVVLARREQLVADLPAAFALLQQKYGTDHPSMISFITGPSRTGDIERILVLGAHGPKRLTILCL
jgi:L-lactate dehydrogenase complex protein LldG